ncbi:Isopentenyl-diphosphate delta-isomerase [Phytophthora cinnamomi]|uniref:Isopentenyl-diphosphate delta-isomerase n=1 Tax=Phytophthora cinnamomi TaxID=4785 RepID=UPI003559D2DB|nr:Isopentenyl-diphosphate delta-isomerase [Phytophthora cinnamomi]
MGFGETPCESPRRTKRSHGVTMRGGVEALSKAISESFEELMVGADAERMEVMKAQTARADEQDAVVILKTATG